MSRLIVILFALVIYPLQTLADTIRQVIESGMTSTLQRTDNVSDFGQYPRILAAFNKIKAHVGDPLIQIRIVNTSSTPAYTARTTVVIHKSYETMSEVEIEFVIAHEIGHIRLKHTEQRIQLYEQHINGEVTEAKAAVANQRIGPAMKRLSYRGEFEADEFARDVMIALGRSKDDVLAAFMAMSRTPDTATHPSTGKRLMNLRNGE